MDTALLIKASGALFAIMNPFVALPMFLALTSDYDLRRQRQTAVKVAIGCLIMAAVIIASGSAVLTFFGISVDDFRVAGGIVLLTIALGMLNGSNASHSGSEQEKQHAGAQAARGDVAFYPITFPMIMGPGTITTIIVLTGRGPGPGTYAEVALAAAAIVAIMFVVLWFAPDIGKHMSVTLRIIMTRLMGMILAGIAVGMVLTGVGDLLPGLMR